MDYGLYRAVNGLTGNGAVDGFFTFVSAVMPVVLAVAVAVIFLAPWRERALERRTGAVTGTLAAAISLLLAQPIAHAVDRARPYLAHPHHAHLLIARSADPSFPSDHATGAFALALGVWAYDRRLGRWLLALAALLSFSRVFVGTHYPGDVAAGILLAALVVAALTLTPLRRPVAWLAQRCSSAWEVLVLSPGSRLRRTASGG